MSARPRSARRRQDGAVLLVALVVLGLMTLAASSAVRFSMAGMRAAVNEELRVDAFQNAQSLVDAVLAEPANLVVTMKLDETNCVPGIGGCDWNSLRLTDADGVAVTSTQLEDSGSTVLLRRIGPEVSTPPRNTGYSAVRFQAAHLEVYGEYDGTEGGWGRAELEEGIVAIVPMLGG